MTEHNRRTIETVFNDFALPDDFSAHRVKQQCKKPLSAKFFDCQNDVLKMLAKRLGFDVSMVNIRLANQHDFSPEHSDLINHTLCQAIEQELRKTDQVFDKTSQSAEFSIILLGTSLDNAQIVVAKIQQAIKKLTPQLLLQAKYSFSIRPLHN